MKKNVIIFFTILLLLIPFKVNAECNVSEKQKLINLAKNVTYKYEYTSDSQFKIKFYNIDDKLRVVDDIGNNYTNDQKKEISYKGGFTRYFYILANNDTSCSHEEIKQMAIKFPLYNKFSENKICSEKKYKDFKYCKKFLFDEVTEKLWNKELEKYNNKFKENIIEKKETNKFNSNIIIIIITISITGLVILGMVILFKNKKNRKW